MIIFKEYETFR